MTLALQTATPEREAALLRAIGFDKLSEPQRELALAIAARYGLDPMLKHIVMIDGRPYITRDGLLHVAHGSGAFDGMETTEPALDADGKFWRATCSIYRKDMTRPFTYTGRYPVAGKNRDYAPEMAIKVGEVMALRRAFDVAAPVIEERWAGGEDADPADDAPAPTSLAERVAAKVATIAPEADAATEQTAPVANDEPAATEPEEPEEPEEGVVREPLQQVVDAVAEAYPAEPTPAKVVASGDDPLKQFIAWLKGRGFTQEEAKRAAKALYPDARGFRDLTPEQIDALRAKIEADVEAARAAIADAAIPATPDNAPFVATANPAGVVPTREDGPALCGSISPLSDNPCTMDAGHAGVHRAGVRESWEQKVGE